MARGRIFWGLVLLLIGILLLLDNLGYLAGINIWGLIWPMFLIALGGWILLSYYSRGKIQVEPIAIPADGAMQASIRMQHGAGRIDLSAGGNSVNLLEGDFGGGLDISKGMKGDELVIRLKTPFKFLPFDWSPGQTLDWSVKVNPDIRLSLSLETGASESRLDLSELHVTELKLKSGASSTTLTLPSHAGFTKVAISSGASSMKITVPQGVAARIRSTGGLSNVSVSERFHGNGGVYQSADYESADNKVDMSIEMGVGSVSIS
jgi:hypothetical protein